MNKSKKLWISFCGKVKIILLIIPQVEDSQVEAYKGRSQLANARFWKKQRESIDYGLNNKCVKFRVLMARKSGAKKYFKFYKSLTNAKNILLSRDSNPWPSVSRPPPSPLRHKDLLLLTIIFLCYSNNFFNITEHGIMINSIDLQKIVTIREKNNPHKQQVSVAQWWRRRTRNGRSRARIPWKEYVFCLCKAFWKLKIFFCTTFSCH